jgi:hypothetical protein
MADKKEAVAVSGLRARLAQLSAQIMRNETELFKGRAHIYYSGPLRKWIKVERHPKDPQNAVILTYSADCPCSEL